MARLPIPKKDRGRWGEILNEFLQVSHTESGDLKVTRWNDNSRPTKPVEGEFGWNTTSGSFEVFADAAWRSIVSGKAASREAPTTASSTAVLSVRDFGARGDGVNDDHHAFSRALQTALDTGRALFVPSGTYLLSAPLLFRKEESLYNDILDARGLRIYGEGRRSELRFSCKALSAAFQIPALKNLELNSLAISRDSVGTLLSLSAGTNNFLLENCSLSTLGQATAAEGSRAIEIDLSSFAVEPMREIEIDRCRIEGFAEAVRAGGDGSISRRGASIKISRSKIFSEHSCGLFDLSKSSPSPEEPALEVCLEHNEFYSLGSPLKFSGVERLKLIGNKLEIGQTKSLQSRSRKLVGIEVHNCSTGAILQNEMYLSGAAHFLSFTWDAEPLSNWLISNNRFSGALKGVPFYQVQQLMKSTVEANIIS